MIIVKQNRIFGDFLKNLSLLGLKYVHSTNVNMLLLRSVSQSKAEIHYSGGRSIGGVKQSVIPRNAPLMKKFSRVTQIVLFRVGRLIEYRCTPNWTLTVL